MSYSNAWDQNFFQTVCYHGQWHSESTLVVVHKPQNPAADIEYDCENSQENIIEIDLLTVQEENRVSLNLIKHGRVFLLQFSRTIKKTTTTAIIEPVEKRL